MSDSSSRHWSDSPNAPEISSFVYHGEKENLAGISIGAICYGIVVILFFQCMGRLLNSANRVRGGIKWWLVAHTVAMFSFVTVYIAATLGVQSISYIDDREAPDGPLVYQFSISTKAISIVPDVAIPVNQWLADGLLLYRCYIIYAMNYWVIAFPGLMYLACVALGIMLFYQSVQPGYVNNTFSIDVGFSYYSISFALNVILTLMIVIRLILHSRNIRAAMETTTKAGGLYRVVVVVLVESSALYAGTFLLYIIPWGLKASEQFISFPVLANAQVIGPFLITLRVASQRVLTNETIVSEHIGSIRFRSQKSTTGSIASPDGHHADSVDDDGKTLDGPGFAAETTADSPSTSSEGSLKTR